MVISRTLLFSSGAHYLRLVEPLEANARAGGPHSLACAEFVQAPELVVERGAVGAGLDRAPAHRPGCAPLGPDMGAGRLRRARIDQTATAITTAPAAASTSTDTSPRVVSSSGDP